jgi:hypothetical protein
VWGLSDSGYGVVGYSILSIGMYGWGYPGVYGESDFGPGLRGRSSSGYGVYGTSNSGLAAGFDGNVSVLCDNLIHTCRSTESYLAC